MATASVAADQLFNVPIDKYLKPSPFNPRGEITPESVADLAASIKVHGIQSPIVVRQTANGPFEIVCGHRRVEAAKVAGLKYAPAIARELTDEQAREVQIVENLQRADIHPMEEAKAYAALRFVFPEGLAPIDDAPWRPKMAQRIAAAVGKSIDYVTKRCRLLLLAPEAQEIFAAGHFTLDHALVIASLEPADQERAVRHLFDRWGSKKKTPLDALVRDHAEDGDTVESVANLRDWVEEHVALRLDKVEWPLDDAKLLPEAGACSSCLKNSAANKPLFGGLVNETRAEFHGMGTRQIAQTLCMDPACFKAKRAAFVQITLGAVAAAGKDAVRLSNKASSAKPKELKEGQPDTRVFKIGQFQPAKKGSCESVVTGVYVDDTEYGGGEATGKPGQKRHVCVDPKCKVHKKSYQQSGGGHGGGARYDPVKEEQRRKAEEAARDREKAVRAAMAKAVVGKVKELTPAMLTQLLLKAWPGFGDLRAIGGGTKGDAGKAKTTSAEFARAAAAVLLFGTCSPWEPKQALSEFHTMINLLGGDAAKLRKEHTPEEKPDAKPAKKAKAKSAAAK